MYERTASGAMRYVDSDDGYDRQIPRWLQRGEEPGLLENNTVLRLREHYTDTHGFTENIFGASFLLGYSFMPRLRDLPDQQLYKLDWKAHYGCLDPVEGDDRYGRNP